MRIGILCFLLFTLGCESDDTWNNLQVISKTEVGLPVSALWGNIRSFSGLQAAAPDVFVREELFQRNNTKERQLILYDGTILNDRISETDQIKNTLKFRTFSSTLPVENMSHVIEVRANNASQSSITWTSNLDVQNINRSAISKKVKGIQESYLFSLELLGEELEELLNDEAF